MVVTSGSPVHDRLSALEFPVLAKPPQSSGELASDVLKVWKELLVFLPSNPSDERWVVQTLIEGRDVGVNVVCQDGRILAATVQGTQ